MGLKKWQNPKKNYAQKKWDALAQSSLRFAVAVSLKLCCFEFQIGSGSLKGIMTLLIIEMLKTHSLTFLPVKNCSVLTRF